MFIGPINPYWWMAQPLQLARDNDIPRIDVGGIYKLTTNAVALTDSTVDYGINPCLYNKLPNESIVLLTIHADVPAGGEGFGVTVVTPNSGASTVTTNPNAIGTGTAKIPVIDSQGTQVTGANVSGNIERLAYINKSAGIIRFLEFTNA